MVQTVCMSVLLLLVLLPQAIFAQQEVPTRNWYFIGLEGGVIQKSNVDSPEVKNSGYELGIKGVVSRYSKNWVGDLGLGYHYDNMDDNGVEVETKAFLGEFGLRYRLSPRVSLGPEVQLLFGEDVSFSDVGTNSDDRSLSVFGGARLLVDTQNDWGDSRFRWGLQALTDLDIDNRRVTYFQVLAEWGWPFEKGQSQPIKEVVVIKEVPVPAKEVEQKPRLKLNLKAAGVQFASGSDQLVGKSKKVIQKLAGILSQYKNEWQLVKIDGHTDVTGNYQKNISLSRKRANSVRTIFIDSGIDETKISARGFGPDRPIDKSRNRAAYSKNRRVELNLISDNASNEFVQTLEKVVPSF